MKRSRLPNRSQRLARSGPIKPKRRSAAAFQRIYGTVERVEWVKSLPCVYCGRQPCENAHTVTGGTGRKADAKEIAPLCAPAEDYIGCHRAYDRHLAPFDTESARELVKSYAPQIEAMWQRRQHPNPEHISGPLGRVLESIMERVDAHQNPDKAGDHEA